MNSIGAPGSTDSPVSLHWRELIGIFVVGAFGGTSPFVMRLAMDLLNNRSRVELITTSIAFGIALLAMLGGGVAVVWKEADLKKAFYLGLGLPSLLTVATSNAPSGAGPKPAAPPSLIVFTVRAADNSGGPVKGRTIRATIPAEAGNDVSFSFSLHNGKTQTIHAEPGGFVQVPDDAESATVASQFAESDSVVLTAKPNVELTLIFSSEADPWYGFWYAIGRKTKPLRLVLARQEIRTVHEAVPTPNNAVPDCSSMRVDQGTLGTFRSNSKVVYVFLVGQSQQIKFGAIHPPDKADMIVATKSEKLKAVIDALPNGAVNSVLIRALRESDQSGYVEEKIENGQAFAVTVDNEKFTVRVETHSVRRFANLTVCPA